MRHDVDPEERSVTGGRGRGGDLPWTPWVSGW
ncbi:hypothetical protein Ae505Ps2_5172c [Pseudonocardia sp. Ae505_Ps2]|nr:hypothetical protein Ae331Ps2_0158c [Pseudonocardia sp. Ae331_Ps2]OLM15040.1 hypothetical protein Ae505Ps2_5172c [Pseudonocardia sp. Ae505_Ps2]